MFDKALFKLPGMRAAGAFLLLSSLVQAVLFVGQALELALALASLWEGQPVGSQAARLAGFFGCFAARHAVALAQGELLDRFSRKRACDLRKQLLAHVFCGKSSLARRIGTASTAQAATGEIDDVARYMRTVPPGACAVAGMSAPLLAALFAIDWASGVIVLASFPVIALFMVMLGNQAKARAVRRHDESRRLSNHFIDTLRGIESISSLGAGKRAAEEVRGASDRLRVATVRTLSVATLSGAVLDLIAMFGVAAVAMMLAFRLMDGTVGLPRALAALMLSPECFAPIRSFASGFHASLDGRTALAHVQAVLSGAESEATGPSASERAPWSAGDTLEAVGVGVSHAEGIPALREASFSCKGFTKVGIVGESGAGKSTLVDVLAGFEKPSSGSFAINGAPIDLGGEWWSKQVHYIPQHPHLFHMSVADNMRFYAPNATGEDIEQAASAMGLDQLIRELPDGLETIVGEGARSLSGGEAERIALARALLDDRPVLLFDEPTAHLDIETELELKQRMLPLMENRLVFFATHRLHWINDMDYVVVLDGGRIVEAGAPSDLLAHGGALRRLASADRGGDAA